MRRHGPIRTCVGCSARDAQAEMVRFHLRDGALVVVGAHPRGRSAYLHRRPECAEGLLASKRLARSLRANVSRDARQVLLASLKCPAGGEVAGPERRAD